MIRFLVIVKNSLLVPVRFVLTFFLVTFLLSGAGALGEWLGLSDPGRTAQLYPLTVFFAAFGRMILPGIALTALIVLTRLHSHPGIPIISLFFALITSVGLIVGSFWLVRITPTGAPDTPVVLPVPTNVLNRSGDAFLFVSRTEDEVVQNVITYSPTDEPRLAFSREGRIEDGRVTLPGSGLTFAISDIDTAPWSLVQPPRGLLGISRDSRSVSAEFERPVFSLRFVAAAVGLSIALLGAWAFLRWTRWPFFNLVVAAAYVRGLLLVPVLLHDEIAVELVWPLLPAWAPGYGSSVAWGVVGLILLAMTVLMRPYRMWRKDVIDE
ncbi:MAG: hypothetical protein EA426_01245 [Spirochaetaceae bacterium]|nr:MAG: hypothetical protein EA426_01245 [Spirochaetaceae bacterium]